VEWNKEQVKFPSDVLRDHDKMKMAAKGLNMYKEKKLWIEHGTKLHYCKQLYIDVTLIILALRVNDELHVKVCFYLKYFWTLYQTKQGQVPS